MKSPETWTCPEALTEKVRRLWDRGEILAAALPGIDADETPAETAGSENQGWRIPLSGPDSPALLEYFSQVQEWIRKLEARIGSGESGSAFLEYQEVNHRQLGANRVPRGLVLPSSGAAVRLLGETKKLREFQSWSREILIRFRALRPWIGKKPFKVLETGEDWPRILDILDWIAKNPNPGIYLRQVDLPGVHTKFLETCRPLIMDLAAALEIPTVEDSPDFHRRFGFLTKPPLVRLRFLDPAMAPGISRNDRGMIFPAEWSLRPEDFAALEPQVSRILMVENEITWLALPPLAGTLAIFGSGYGFDALKSVRWMERIPIFYWGDLDTHGFGILDQVRHHFPHTRSLLMDRETLLSHQSLWTREPTPLKRTLDRLTPEEREVYEGLRDNLWGPEVRMEQERLGYSLVIQGLEAVCRQSPQ